MLKLLLIGSILGLFILGCERKEENSFATETQKTPKEISLPNPAKTNSPSKPALKVVTLEVYGMTWGVSCDARVASILEKCKGVKKVQIDFEKQQAIVTGDSKVMQVKTLLEALDKTGLYKGIVLKK